MSISCLKSASRLRLYISSPPEAANSVLYAERIAFANVFTPNNLKIPKPITCDAPSSFSLRVFNSPKLSEIISFITLELCFIKKHWAITPPILTPIIIAFLIFK